MTETEIPLAFWNEVDPLNPFYHPIEPRITVNIGEKQKFDAINHHDNDAQNYYHESEEPIGRE